MLRWGRIAVFLAILALLGMGANAGIAIAMDLLMIGAVVGVTALVVSLTGVARPPRR